MPWVNVTFSHADKYRNASDSNQQHDSEVCSARDAVEEDVGKSSENMLHHLDSEYFRSLAHEFFSTLQLIPNLS